MVQAVIGLVLVASLPTMTWWYWWRAKYRRPLGQRLEQLRINVGLTRLVLGLFVVLAVMQGVSAAADGSRGQWWTTLILVGAIALSVPPLILARRLLDGSRPGPSIDLDRRTARLRRWTVPTSIGMAFLPGLALIGGDVSVVRVLIGSVSIGLFMFAVLTAMRVVIERSVGPSRCSPCGRLRGLPCGHGRGHEVRGV